MQELQRRITVLADAVDHLAGAVIALADDQPQGSSAADDARAKAASAKGKAGDVRKRA